MISLRAFESPMTSPREIETVENAIHLVRGQRVMLDSDLAAIYGVTTKRLNERLRRNPNRFPPDFAFQLTREEFTNLRSQFATSSLRSRSATSKHGGRRYRPWVFTEHGAIMLASVLDSEVAIDASVRVVRAFVRLREIISANAELAAKFAQLERRLDSQDETIAQLFAAIRQLLAPPPEKKREIGFHVRERAARYRTKGQA
jgi:ORF6N domain-containing protein